MLAKRRISICGVAIAALLGAVVAQPAFAATVGVQNIGLENTWCINPPADSSVCGTTGLVQSGPITNSVSNTYSPSPPTTFSGSMTETSSYGVLSASGTATVTNSAVAGSLGFLEPYFSDPADGVPVALYQDLLTITGTGPVSIQFSEVLTASDTHTANANVSIADQLSVSGGSSIWNVDLTNTGSETTTLTFNPGDQVSVIGELLAGGGVYAPDLAPPMITASFSYDLSDPLYLDVLTPGGGYTAASGTVYGTLNSAPEPGSFLLLCVGMIGLAAVVRSRRHLCTRDAR